jgi:stage II sporulation protein D
VSRLCWSEREQKLLAPDDPEYLLQVEDRAELTVPAEQRAAALLIAEGVLSPSSTGRLRPHAEITRAEALGLLARAALRSDPPALIKARFRGAQEARLAVLRGEQEEVHPLEATVRLYRSLDDQPAPASKLTLVAGEEVWFVLNGGRVAFLEARQSRLGVAADHGSRYYRWDVTRTPAQLASSVARYGRVGEVRDVRALRLGSSGRVVQMAVLGDEGELVLKGLEVRRGLGLRENLFVLERETDPASGAIQRFKFSGKGWGHGVGLCQVGAFGMARAGASYDEILRHYYTGITVGPQ